MICSLQTLIPGNEKMVWCHKNGHCRRLVQGHAVLQHGILQQDTSTAERLPLFIAGRAVNFFFLWYAIGLPVEFRVPRGFQRCLRLGSIGTRVTCTSKLAQPDPPVAGAPARLAESTDHDPPSAMTQFMASSRLLTHSQNGAALQSLTNDPRGVKPMTVRVPSESSDMTSSLRETSRSPRGAIEGDWPGCHVAHGKVPWILGLEDLKSTTFGDRELPDISIDPGRKVLSVINAQDETRCFYISVFSPCLGRVGRGAWRRFASGAARRTDGSTVEVTTFVLVVPARNIMDVCKLSTKDVQAVDVHSDIVVFKPTPALTECSFYGFPLEGGPFRCSQGRGGKLTHFAHPSTFYALDFDCPVGTPVLAMEEGIVTQRLDQETVSGIDVENFFKWNQLTIHQKDGTWAEYVHLEVLRGQCIARSGDVGFCPTPHLHVEVHRSSAADAASVPFAFQTEAHQFECQEGKWYTAQGEDSKIAPTRKRTVVATDLPRRFVLAEQKGLTHDLCRILEVFWIPGSMFDFDVLEEQFEHRDEARKAEKLKQEVKPVPAKAALPEKTRAGYDPPRFAPIQRKIRVEKSPSGGSDSRLT
eukprot:s1144_g12.t1